MVADKKDYRPFIFHPRAVCSSQLATVQDRAQPTSQSPDHVGNEVSRMKQTNRNFSWSSVASQSSCVVQAKPRISRSTKFLRVLQNFTNPRSCLPFFGNSECTYTNIENRITICVCERIHRIWSAN